MNKALLAVLAFVIGIAGSAPPSFGEQTEENLDVGENSELPVKDGVYDHPIDALRYFFVNYKNRGKTISRRY
jgi:hypothetical protein